MSSLQRQKVEISAASLLSLVSLAAGMVGLLIGRRTSIRSAQASPPDRGAADSSTTQDRPLWQSVSEVERQIRARDASLDEMRRAYELDTGLLKAEIHRLSERLDAAADHPHDSHPESSNPSPLVDEGAAGAAGRSPGIRFSTLEHLVSERENPSAGS